MLKASSCTGVHCASPLGGLWGAAGLAAGCFQAYTTHRRSRGRLGTHRGGASNGQVAHTGGAAGGYSAS